jgi:hypothetical protein
VDPDRPPGSVLPRRPGPLHLAGIRFDRIEARFERIDSKFDTIDWRFDRIDQKLDRGVSELRSEIRAGVERMERRFTDHEARHHT